MAELTNQHRPISEVLGRDTSELRLLVESEPDPAVRVRLLSTFLATIQPEQDATAGAVADLVDEISRRRDLTQVGQVADLAGLSVRGLQRLFADYVGAGPKWVIQRFRLQEAAARAAGPGPVNWSALALELGFADQAHLTRVFTATIGTSPAAFAAEAHG